MIIRRVPTDFLVEELLSPRFSAGIAATLAPATTFAVYRLEKTSMTTPDAVRRLAKALKLPAPKLSYAGLKDKHAVTTQHITAPLSARGSEQAPRAPDGRGWSAMLLGWSPMAIDASAIENNRFTIVIRDIARDRSPTLDLRAAMLAATPAVDGSRRLTIVNYFGDQRFGSARHGQGFAAAHLARGEFEQALRLLIATPARKDSGKRREFTRAAAAQWGDWAALAAALPAIPERRAIEVLARNSQSGSFRDAFAALPGFLQSFCIEAYQAYLWNAVARQLVEQECAADGGLLRADDDFGEMLFPSASTASKYPSQLHIPMLSPATRFEPPWGDIAASVLADEGLCLEQLRVPGLRRPRFGEALRPLIITADNLRLSDAEPDDLGRPGRLKRTAGFDLPRGAYATVVLRAIGQ